jgi:hypothetical protein
MKIFLVIRMKAAREILKRRITTIISADNRASPAQNFFTLLDILAIICDP